MANKEEKYVMAMCMPYNNIQSVSRKLMEENIILMAEAEAKIKAEAEAKARTEVEVKPLMRSIEPYDNDKKIKKTDKKVEKLKNLYGF